jgi:hypothetical protein
VRRGGGGEEDEGRSKKWRQQKWWLCSISLLSFSFFCPIQHCEDSIPARLKKIWWERTAWIPLTTSQKCTGFGSLLSLQKNHNIFKLEVSFEHPSLVAPLSWQVDGIVLGEVHMNVRVLVLGSTSTHKCRSTGTREY